MVSHFHRINNYHFITIFDLLSLDTKIFIIVPGMNEKIILGFFFIHFFLL